MILYQTNVLLQPGTPRTRQGIKGELEKQVALACKGVVKPIDESQTRTGTKDAYTQYWINKLIQQFKDMKSEGGRTTAQIRATLTAWVSANSDKIYSGFLTTEGEALEPPCIIYTR